MKYLLCLLTVFSFPGAVSAKETAYTASTPADDVVRRFLGISLTDSIDFIRWKLSLTDISYSLECHYGISKPNTNGFIKDGKKVYLQGTAQRNKNTYQLKNGKAILWFAILNDDLLHIMDGNNGLLAGNGGWSYSMNSLKPSQKQEAKAFTSQLIVKDSMVFDGRTPCGIPGMVKAGEQCYKLKWRITLYGNNSKQTAQTFKILSTTWRDAGAAAGKWISTKNKYGQTMYQLEIKNHKIVLYLLPAGDILLFTDAEGNPLVGDHDFSYTLNRKK